MSMKITLRHLEAFRAVMVRRTVTGAAEMLGVTQPVVTRLIADLEQRIAIALFTRDKGRLAPTPEATLLFADVNQSLMGIERIANAASGIKALKLGHLEIAAAPNMALSFLPRAIASFSLERPETLITMHMHSSSTVLDMVQSGRCNLGFAMVPVHATRHGNSETLVSAKMVGVIPVGHRLATRKVLNPEDLGRKLHLHGAADGDTHEDRLLDAFLRREQKDQCRNANLVSRDPISRSGRRNFHHRSADGHWLHR